MNTAVAFLESRREALEAQGIPIAARWSSLMVTPRFQASRHVVFLLMPEGDARLALVAKVPRLVDPDPTLAREAASLRGIQALRPGGFDSVPTLVAYETFGGRPILVETALSGSMLNPSTVRRDRDRCCALVLDWLTELHAVRATTDGSEWFAELVDGPLLQFAESFPISPDDELLVRRTREIVAPLRAAALPFVWEHGDLSHPNLLLTGRDRIGVIDWELARPSGQLAYDLFVFLAYVAFSRRGTRRTADQVRSVRSAVAGHDAWALPVIQAYASRCRIPQSLLTPLFVLCWARYTTTLVSRLTGGRNRLRSADMASWVRANRYYRLWVDAVTHAGTLDWSH
jgi:aminoglycoside phosphotransferase (APT) family kinase protein